LSSEFELIRRYFDRPARSAVLGVGDDAALLRVRRGMDLAVSTDMLIEGRHFRRGAEPRALGHKALAVNLSDMAAMGATPRWATLALALPSADRKWLSGFASGFFRLARRHEVDLVGGDTTRGPLSICVTIFGEVPAGKALRRDGAKAGDDIWVSGELGGAAFALRSNNRKARKKLDTPEPRVALGRRLRGRASAAIDVSDGFAQDLGHILERSGVGAVVHYDRLPKFPLANAQQVLAGGDDYELVFTAPERLRESIGRLEEVTLVGKIRRSRALLVLDGNGKAMRLARGFDHFA
jgi:thiamine-monophosphate kinase